MENNLTVKQAQRPSWKWSPTTSEDDGVGPSLPTLVLRFKSDDAKARAPLQIQATLQFMWPHHTIRRPGSTSREKPCLGQAISETRVKSTPCKVHHLTTAHNFFFTKTILETISPSNNQRVSPCQFENTSGSKFGQCNNYHAQERIHSQKNRPSSDGMMSL